MIKILFFSASILNWSVFPHTLTQLNTIQFVFEHKITTLQEVFGNRMDDKLTKKKARREEKNTSKNSVIS